MEIHLILERNASRSRALLEQLLGGSMVATSRAKLGVHHYSLNLLLRTGLVQVDEKPGHVVLRITDAGRVEVGSW